MLFHFQSKDLECRIKLAGEPIKDAGYGLAVKKGNPLRDRISELIISYQDRGHFTSLKSRWMSTKCEDSSVAEGSGGVNQLGVNSFGSLFLVMSAGVLVVIFILKCEILYKSFSMKSAKGLFTMSDNKTTTSTRINIRDILEPTSIICDASDNNNCYGIDNVTFVANNVCYQENKISDSALSPSLKYADDDDIDDGVVFDEPVDLFYRLRIPDSILQNEIQRKLKELKPVTFNTAL